MSETTTTLTPYLCCRNATEALEFYQKAFGAEPDFVLKHPNGGLVHATLSIQGAQFHLSEECPEQGGRSPQSLGGSPVTLHLHVPDCDAVVLRAVDAGCEVRMPLADMFWGDRFGVIADPYGHQWSIATKVRDVSMDEVEQAVAAFPGG
jgi:PhnB protein